MFLLRLRLIAKGVPEAVEIGYANHHPQKRPIPRQAGLAHTFVWATKTKDGLGIKVAALGAKVVFA